MGLIDDKKNVFTTIGAYTSLKQERNLPDATNLYPSVNNKKDAIPFLLDVLKTVVGSTALKDLTGELFTKFVDGVEPKMKDALKNQMIQFDAGNLLPDEFKTNGYTVPVKDIDIYGKLKTNPNSNTGSLLYGVTNSFDSVAYQAIVNNGTETPYNNMYIKYNSVTDSFTFKPKLDVTPNPSVGDWMGSFIDDTVLIDKKEFLTNVMDGIYGSVASNQNKTTEELYQELQIKKLIENLIEDNDTFEITQDEFDVLLQKAKELQEGVVYYDMGCRVVGATLPLSGMTALIQQISGSTDSFAVGNAVESTIDSSLVDNSDIANENKETIKDGFFQRLIRIIQQMLAQILTTSPQIRALLAISSAFKNNNVVQIGNPKDDLKKFKVFLKCIIKEAIKMINEFIFNIVVSFLIALLSPIIKKIIREKINQYVSILKSLIT
jgi:hypothetical protein